MSPHARIAHDGQDPALAHALQRLALTPPRSAREASLARRIAVPAWTALVLAALAYVFLRVALEPARSLAIHADNEFLLGPLLNLMSRIASAGEWPLRTDTILGGFPLYDLPQLSALYPFYFTWLPVFGDPMRTMRAMHVIAVGHMVLLEFAAYGFLRVAGASRIAAVAGAALIAFSAYTYGQAFAGIPYAWLLLYLAGLLRLLDAPGDGRAAAAMIAGLVLLTLASPAQHLVYVVILTVVLAAVHGYLAGALARRRVRFGLGAIALSVLIALLLCAPVLVPVLADLPSMTRWIGPFEPIRASARIPFAAFQLDQLSFASLGGVLYPFERPVTGDPYVGVITVALAIIALALRWRSWLVVAMTILTAYGLSSALGRHAGLAYVNHLLPLVNRLAEAGRMLLLFQLGIGVLAALGIDALGRMAMDDAGRAPRRRVLMALAALTVSCAAVLALQSHRVTEPALARISLAVLVVLVAATFVLTRRRSRAFALALQLVWSVAAVMLLAAHVVAEVPQESSSDYVTHRMADLDAAIARVAQRDPSHEYRLLFDGSIDKQSAAMLASYRGVRTLDAYVNPAPSRQFEEIYYHAAERGNYFRALGARYLVCRECPPAAVRDYRHLETVAGYEVYEADEALPHWYVVTHKDGEFGDLADFKARVAPQRLRNGVLFTQPGALRELEAGSADSAATCRPRELARTSSLQRIALDCPAQAVLVVNEFFEPAWRATLDGERAAVFRVNGNQMGVRVPPGARVVELRYRPKTLETGFALAGVGLLAVVLLPFLWRRVRWPSGDTRS